MNSQEYNELAIHCKELLDKKDFILEIYKKENMDLKKILLMSYTYARQIDEYCNIFIGEESSNELSQHAEAFRGLMSEMLDKYIFI
tara:strand:- start:199 stop:456 length:258 start_codon:yes stop_codon:yes gene_type:complete